MTLVLTQSSKDRSMTNYSKLPLHMQKCAQDYVERGILNDDFLEAVVRDRFVDVFKYADEMNALHMHDWATWAYNELSTSARGCNVDEWIKAGGMEGLNAEGIRDA